VIIPCFKQADLLALAVASVANQTFRDWELIIVDDGSPDDTSAVASRLMAGLPGCACRLVRQENAGLAAARNAGVAAARGAYVLPLDADDAIDPTYLEKAVAVLDRRPEIQIVTTDGMTFGAKEERLRQDPDTRWARTHLENCLLYCSLYRREVWATVGGYNPNMTMGYEDWDFWVGCREAGLAVAHLPEPLFYYRVKVESMYTRALRHDRQLRARIVLNHPSLYAPAEREQAARLLEREPLPAHGQAVPSAPLPPPARPVAGTAAAAAP
jgi:glycosyltransferase involved in cell wall biosynthesis